MRLRPFWITALAAMATLLTACTTTQTLPREAAAGLRGQNLLLSTHAPTPFSVQTAGNSLWGGLGAIGGGIMAANMESQGAQVARQHKLTDPTPAMAAQLAQALQRQWGMRVVNPPLASDSDDAATLAAAARGRARYLLSVQTQVWGMTHISATRYTVQYNTRARLIDTQSGQVIAQADCNRPLPTGVNDSDPTYDQMLANDAAILKQLLRQSADDCLATLRQRMVAG